jgi:hypothetical protein
MKSAPSLDENGNNGFARNGLRTIATPGNLLTHCRGTATNPRIKNEADEEAKCGGGEDDLKRQESKKNSEAQQVGHQAKHPKDKPEPKDLERNGKYRRITTSPHRDNI